MTVAPCGQDGVQKGREKHTFLKKIKADNRSQQRIVCFFILK